MNHSELPLASSLGLATADQLRKMRDGVRQLANKMGLKLAHIQATVSFDQRHKDFIVTLLGLPKDLWPHKEGNQEKAA